MFTVLFSAAVFPQSKEVTIEEISKNPDAFSSTAVETEGIVTQYVPSTSKTTSYYIVNGEYGGHLKVNTSSAAPELFKRYRIAGTVYIDPLNKEPFLSEKTRSSLDPIGTSAQSEGTDPLVILLVVLFLLLAAIFVYTQLRRRRERNYDDVIYALPVNGSLNGMPDLPETPLPDKPVEVPLSRPRMEPLNEKYTPEKHTPESHAPERHADESFPSERIKPERIRLVKTPPERTAPEKTAPEKTAPERKTASELYEADFRTIKIVPPAPQTITFIPGQLEIISGEDKGKSFRIAGFPTAEGSVVSIGREVVTGEKAYAHIQLNEKFRTVSRRQAELIYKDHKLLIRNLSETNLTQVDGLELQPGECAELKPNAKIRTGELEFQYKIN
ncbi:MAG TPA: FHA domain-containing protein [Ignavibacteriales bacterium]|nr:FHA domain-containing protein [Ignavibacteriales bacterium]